MAGISAEQIEQQVTIPLEVVMNGIPGVEHLRSFSLFGLSDLKLVFDDGTENAWNRERVLERLSQVTLPPGVVPQMGTDWSPVGQIYFFTLHSSNPAYDVMELKSIEDWAVEKNFKAVPNIVDVASFGGPNNLAWKMPSRPPVSALSVLQPMLVSVLWHMPAIILLTNI